MKSSPYNWVISFSSPYMNYISRVLVTAHLKIYKGVDLSCKCCEEYVIFEFVCISQRPLDRHCPWCQSRKMLVQSRVLKPHWSLTSSLPSRKGKFQTHSPGGFQQNIKKPNTWNQQILSIFGSYEYQKTHEKHAFLKRLLGPSKNPPYPHLLLRGRIAPKSIVKMLLARHLRLEPVSFSSIFGLKKTPPRQGQTSNKNQAALFWVSRWEWKMWTKKGSP